MTMWANTGPKQSYKSFVSNLLLIETKLCKASFNTALLTGKWFKECHLFEVRGQWCSLKVTLFQRMVAQCEECIFGILYHYQYCTYILMWRNLSFKHLCIRFHSSHERAISTSWHFISAIKRCIWEAKQEFSQQALSISIGIEAQFGQFLNEPSAAVFSQPYHTAQAFI